MIIVIIRAVPGKLKMFVIFQEFLQNKSQVSPGINNINNLPADFLRIIDNFMF